MFRTMMIAVTGGAMMLFAAPLTAQQLEVDHNAMIAPVSDASPVHVTAKMPAVLPQQRSQFLVSNDELNAQRGGEQLIVTNQTLTAITQGNVLNGDFLAGDVNLSDSALSSFNGVGNILINTGAQVSLQTGMNLTINVGG